jgi:sugar/nucleoside kinase (ribokinase family)
MPLVLSSGSINADFQVRLAVPPEVLPLVVHLTPDHREAVTLTGADASTDAAALRAERDVRDRGPGVVCVKLRGGGCAVAWARGGRARCASARRCGPEPKGFPPSSPRGTGGGSVREGGLRTVLAAAPTRCS